MDFINQASEMITSAIIGGAIASIGVYFKSIRKKSRAQQKAIEAIAHDSFFRACRYILDKGCITEADLENLEHLYKGYNGLGLNGMGTEMYKRCKNMPLTT